MNCDICHRPYHATRLPFFCAVDARNHCYEARISHLQGLLRNEELEKKVDGLLSPSSPPAQVPAAPDATHLRALGSDQLIAEDHTREIVNRAERLRSDIVEARAEIAKRKAQLARRRSELASAANGIAARRARQQADAERAIQMVRVKWDLTADTMASTRAFLCLEAAKLYGLRRIKKTGSRYEYRLGGLEVVDIASMNGLSPEVISTSLAHIAHILMLASHYLSIRLPCEIILPHRDYPRPTIFTLASSYKFKDVPFPGSTNPTIAALAASNGQDTNLDRVPHPRPLFIDKPLPVLAKEDPSTYSYLLEGVCHLAYDIAWLCQSQNVPVGDRGSFHDICHMGRNLYNFFIGHQIHTRHPATMIAPPLPPLTQQGNTTTPETDDLRESPTWMGRYSHGTTHRFLGSAAGTEFIRSFKLTHPMKLVDKLKNRIVSELTIPEWEVLDHESWVLGDDTGDGIVVPSSATVSTAPKTPSEANAQNKPTDTSTGGDKGRDNSGNSSKDKGSRRGSEGQGSSGKSTPRGKWIMGLRG